MKRIYKYQLQHANEQIVYIPGNSRMLRVDLQNERWTLWAEFETTESTFNRPKKLFVFGTGQEIPTNQPLHYINTFFQNQYVWHAYEGGDSL